MVSEWDFSGHDQSFMHTHDPHIDRKYGILINIKKNNISLVHVVSILND